MLKYNVNRNGQAIEYEDRPQSDTQYWNTVWARDGHWAEYHIAVPYCEKDEAARWLLERGHTSQSTGGDKKDYINFIFMPWDREIAMEFKLVWG